ncbi:MAG: hypothetical protein ACWA5P_07620 [bacterium]
MKKLILLSVLSITLTSCLFIGKSDVIKCTIKNNSDGAIENVIISTSENLAQISFENIASNQSVTERLSMKGNKTDGSYTLAFTQSDGTKVSKKYGYYTNGIAVDDWVVFEIQKDTIIANFSGTDY